MCMLCHIVHAVQKSWGGFGQHTRLAQQTTIVKAYACGSGTLNPPKNVLRGSWAEL